MLGGMKATAMRLVVLLVCYDCVASLIIPEELPTILSLIYSNIPPVKKGTDSRIGVGFRLGEHADFQILLELGPQTETDPIGNTDTKRRRQATLDAAMRGELGPWAQAVAKYQTERRIQKELDEMRRLAEKLQKVRDDQQAGEERKNDQSGENSNANEWLSKWSRGMAPSPEEVTPRERLPVQDILPNITENKIVAQRIGEAPERGNDNVVDKMEKLSALLKPQPNI